MGSKLRACGGESLSGGIAQYSLPEKRIDMMKCWLRWCLMGLVSCGVVCSATFEAASLSAQPPAEIRRSPLPPDESLKMIELAEGQQARLLAHEPQIVDPVEAVFDDAGRLWVVEMPDYPIRVSDQPQGQIVVLSDPDGDGLYDTARVFADQLEMPTGMALWKAGVVATVAGKLVYLTDTNGDGRADHTQVWLEGFTEDNEQLRANHPRLGPDGWWYIACGLRGGAVQLGPELRGDSPAESLEIGSRDVRFHLATKTIELITGPAQFGLTFDSLGQRLFCSNRNPAVQVIFEQADLIGNPLAGLAPSIVDVVPAGDDSRVYPLVDAWVTSHLHSGQFTAACGVFSNGSADGLTDVYTCEPTGSLVHRQRSTRIGTRLTPAPEQPDAAGHEWLASRDAWFRPVNVNLAPDGGLIVVDMHRAVIEHPAWVPEELKHRPDERWGDRAGRIVWVGPAKPSVDPAKQSVDPAQQSVDPAQQSPSVWSQLRDRPLASRSDAELIALVGADNRWLRETAKRLLLEREADGASQSLQRLAADASLPTDARCDALRLASLLSQGAQTEIDFDSFLGADLTNSGQQAVAVVALSISRQDHSPSVHPDRLLKLATSAPSSGVRFEAWLCLGAAAEQGTEASAELAAEAGQQPVDSAHVDAVTQAWLHDGDSYVLMAAASGLREQPAALLQSWLQALSRTSQLNASAAEQVTQIARALTAATLRQAAPVLAQDNVQQPHQAAQHHAQVTAQLAQILEMVSQAVSQTVAGQPDSEASPGQNALRLAALECLQPIVKQAKLTAQLAPELWEDLAKLAEDPAQPVNLRVATIGLLADSPRQDTTQRLAEMVTGTSDPELTGPLLQTWCAIGEDAPDELLIERLSSATPQLQRILLPLVASSEARLGLLAQQMRAGRITAGQIGVAELTKLVARAGGDTQTQLQQQLSLIANSDRSQAVEQYKPSLAFDPDVHRGLEVFRKHCASCHRVGEVGVDVGPNISDSRTKQPLELLTAILDPNLAIDNNYFRYVVLTEDGRVIEGIIAEETADALVIRGQDDKRELIRREDIDTMKATGVSLMPDGLEAQIDQQSMADLIGFIKGWRYMDGAVPGK